MKKILQILCIAVYLFSTIGLTIAYHFCGDTLVSTEIVTVSSKTEPSDCCSESEEESGCCHNQFKSYKLDDFHFASANVVVDSQHSNVIDYPQATLENFFTTQKSNQFSHQTHSPPGEHAYLINRVFRI